MQDFRKLRVWHASRELTVGVYRATAAFPPTERYGLAAQMRTAAVSIGANIAEGCGRGSRADTLRFLQMAFASAVELLHHLITSLDLGFLTPSEFEEMENKLDPIRRMLASLMARLRSPRERVSR
jgi:four helix bundle protein